MRVACRPHLLLSCRTGVAAATFLNQTSEPETFNPMAGESPVRGRRHQRKARQTSRCLLHMVDLSQLQLNLGIRRQPRLGDGGLV
ncbi:unnamed protein product [Symbiodinium pilosum]|uniref:Secreted protein n=1 Tax=Symbiodinium pilosum TaxID=2952 RepID=A0A812XDU5_SYMPI|nr:unnamed protein product [Symbiodinium pilosum]